METTANPAIAANARIPRSPGYSNGSPDEFVEDLPCPNTGNGMPASRDGHVLPEYTTAETVMEAGVDAAGQSVTIMRFRFDDGTPYPQTVGGHTASEWRLMFANPNDPAAGHFWEPQP